MGVATNCNLTFFTKEKEKIKKIVHDGRADGFIYNLINDGGSTAEPDKLGNFTEKEKEILIVYFDEKSMSVMEGYATVTPNIQDPKILKRVWTRIRNGVIKQFDQFMNEYHEQLSLDPSSKISEHSFKRKIFDYTWSLDTICGILSLLDLAIINDQLVEITVSDF